MPVTGPDFISLQVRDLDASQAFYEHYLGLVRAPAGPPHAVVFDTTPIAFAVRDIVPGTDWHPPRNPASAPRSGCTPLTSSRFTMPSPPTATRSRPIRSTDPSAAPSPSPTRTAT